jgi:hypothetical protein
VEAAVMESINAARSRVASAAGQLRPDAASQLLRNLSEGIAYVKSAALALGSSGALHAQLVATSESCLRVHAAVSEYLKVAAKVADAKALPSPDFLAKPLTCFNLDDAMTALQARMPPETVRDRFLALLIERARGGSGGGEDASGSAGAGGSGAGAGSGEAAASKAVKRATGASAAGEANTVKRARAAATAAASSAGASARFQPAPGLLEGAAAAAASAAAHQSQDK